MIHLPPVFGPLASLAASENPRYAADCLKVFEYQEGRYRIDVTDCRHAMIVKGQSSDVPEAGEGDAFEGLIPCAAWTEAFRKRKGQPKDRAVALRLTKKDAFVNTLPEPVAQAEGVRFPPVREVYPKGTPRFSIRVGAKQLSNLLAVADKLLSEEEIGITLHFFDTNKPLGISGQNVAMGYVFDGLLMPLEAPKEK